MKKIISVSAAALALFILLQCTVFAAPVFTDSVSAGEYVAAEMKKISPEVKFDYRATGIFTEEQMNAEAMKIFSEVYDESFRHTGEPNGGEYLRYTFDHMGRNVRMESDGNGNCDFHFTYSITYNLSPEQEKALTEHLDKIMPELMAACKNDYERVCIIHDYILTTASYDNEHDADYKLRFTAYAAALNENRAVCEGYALLFYRMCLLAGIDCRVVLGKSFNANHTWNIVKLDGKWYNVDCTWDDSIGKIFFLKGSKNFSNHTSTSDYISENYKVSEEDFDREAYLSANSLKKGDADGDGKTDVGDARLVLRIAIGLETIVSAGTSFTVCDTDGNGKIDVSDARNILRIAIGLEK